MLELEEIFPGLHLESEFASESQQHRSIGANDAGPPLLKTKEDEASS